MNNINQLLAQAQKLQANMTRAQKEIENREVTGSAGSGAVQIVLTVTGKMKSIHIDQKVIDSSDSEMLEDLVLAAFNDAKSQADRIYESEMKKATGGLPVPGMF